jgi:hypothetical protein
MAFLDTHKAIERIISTGVSKETAEAIVDSVNTKNDDVATKADLYEMRIELKSDINELRTKLETDIHELRTELKSEVSSINTNVKWLMAIVLALVGILLKNTFI